MRENNGINLRKFPAPTFSVNTVHTATGNRRCRVQRAVPCRELNAHLHSTSISSAHAQSSNNVDSQALTSAAYCSIVYGAPATGEMPELKEKPAKHHAHQHLSRHADTSGPFEHHCDKLSTTCFVHLLRFVPDPLLFQRSLPKKRWAHDVPPHEAEQCSAKFKQV